MGLDQTVIMGLDQMERRFQLSTMTEAIVLTTTLSTNPVVGKPFDAHLWATHSQTVI